MPRYHLRYLKGPTYTLNLEYDGIVEASSFEEALRPHTDWPITESYDHATATAWTPGTCIIRKCGKLPCFPTLTRDSKASAARS